MTEMITWSFGILSGIGVLMAGLGYGYGQFKKGNKNVDDETINSLQRQLDTIVKELNEVRKENKELVGLNNQLQGQLKTYKEIVSLQDPEFRASFSKMADSYESMQKELKCHYTDDNKRFNEIVVRLDKGVKRGKLQAGRIEGLENA